MVFIYLQGWDCNFIQLFKKMARNKPKEAG